MLGFAPKAGALGDFLSLQDSGSVAGMTAGQDSGSGAGMTASDKIIKTRHSGLDPES